MSAKETRQQGSKLLIDESPLLVLPSLAKLIGVNEAIVLQQLHYWLQKSDNMYDGHRWVFNTYRQWREDNFPFWSEPTIQRIFTSLESKGVVVSCRLNAQDWNQRKWYRIDLDALSELAERAEAA